MPRFRMTVEYDGSTYVGWQIQDNGASVQGALQKAILSLTGETVSVRGAGRTDSGVHALGQVVHADLRASGCRTSCAMRSTPICRWRTRRFPSSR